MTTLLNGVRPARLVVVPLAVALTLTACVESDRPAEEAVAGGETTECPFTPDESVTTTARIAYQNIPNADLVVQDLGLLEACMPNADISWNQFSSGGDVVQAFGSDSVDIGLLGSSPATIGLSEPLLIDMQVVWVHDVIGDAESLVVKDDAITDLAGLQGQTIAVPFGSTAHYSLLQALQEEGLDPAADVEIINLTPEAMASAWQGDDIAAAWVWAPTLTELTATGTAILSSEDTAEAGRPTYDLGAATTEFVEANPEFMTVWAQAQDYAVKLIRDSPDEAAVSVAAMLGASPDEVLEQFEGYIYLDATEQASPEYLGGQLAVDLQNTAQFLLDQGGIDAVNDPAAYEAGVNAEPAASASTS